VVFLVVGGVKLLSSESVYFVEFTESVSGLSDGASVSYKGVPIGSVRKIRFKPGDIGRIEVLLAIRHGIDLRSGTKATIRPRGITGVSYVELSGGASGEASLEPGSTITADPSLLGSLETNLPEVLTGFRDALDELKTMLGPDSREKLHVVLDDLHGVFGDNKDRIASAVTRIEGSAEKLDQALDSLKAAASDVRGVVSESRPDVESAVKDFRDAASRVKELLARGDVDTTVTNVRDASANVKRWTDEHDLGRTLAGADAAVADLRRTIATIDGILGQNGGNIDDVFRSLREGALAVEDLMKQVRDNPGILLAKPRPEREP
jgi:phospholipid/cholesterol/gamma-HCH transport system substrate-binding protein